MKKFNTGVIVGKFYPPHNGHHYLIDTAAEQCEELVVIIIWKKEETIPFDVRLEALLQRHPRVQFTGSEDIICDDDDSEAWAKFTYSLLGFCPEAVFTSEDYGDAFAKFLNATHVKVDQDRTTVPCSGTIVRNAPLDNMQYLSPYMRAYFVKRIVIVGAESTGTSTLAESLAKHYATNVVPEYGRQYCEEKTGVEWCSDDFIKITQGQIKNEDTLAETANKVLICDTDPFATTIWHNRYMGEYNAELQAIADNREYDLYILTDDGIPFVQDGTRDGEHIRHWMHEEFIRQLDSFSRHWRLVAGTPEERMKQAIQAIDDVVAGIHPRKRPRFFKCEIARIEEDNAYCSVFDEEDYQRLLANEELPNDCGFTATCSLDNIKKTYDIDLKEGMHIHMNFNYETNNTEWVVEDDIEISREEWDELHRKTVNVLRD